MTKKSRETELAEELEEAFQGVPITDNDVMNVGASPTMGQAQQFITLSHATGSMIETGVNRAHNAQSVGLANVTLGLEQILKKPKPFDLKKRSHMNKRLNRILSELKAAKMR